MLDYKERPWVLRHRDAQDLHLDAAPRTNIRLTINLSLDGFTEHYQRMLTHAVASFLDVSPNDIKIKKVESGSIIVTLEIPLASIERLSDRTDFSGFGKSLDHLHVEKIEVVKEFVREFSEEARLVLMWERLLGLEGIGYSDNFFECGGSSLLLVRLHAEIEKEFGIDLPVVELFRYPTIASVAKRIRELQEAAGVSSPALPAAAARAESSRDTHLRQRRLLELRRGGRRKDT